MTHPISNPFDTAQGKLQSLLAHLPHANLSNPSANPSLHHVTADSRDVRDGTLFVAVPGDSVDGHRFIGDAVARGAVAVVGTATHDDLLARNVGLGETPYVQLLDSRLALAVASAALYDFPSRALTVIGVTGTDGKTTTCSILESILAEATRDSSDPDDPGRVGVITTVGARIRGEEQETGLHVTTPDAPQVQQFLAQMRDAGCTYAIVESTSHGLAQQRVAAVDFDVAAVTNITHEHLDYHGTRENYVAAKARLFQMLFESPAKPFVGQDIPRAAVLNADDAGSYEALQHAIEDCESDCHVIRLSYALNDATAAVRATNIDAQPDRTRFRLRWWDGAFDVETRLIGDFNVYNILCAATVTLALGVPTEAVQRGVAQMAGVLGRMERIDRGQAFLALVDFAHSPASLERALLTLRDLVTPSADGEPGRLIALFGSAGLRDHAKRGWMGQISGRLADFTVITAEDPRTESLDAINAAIAAGVRQYASDNAFVIVPDRAEAMQYAVDMARAGDVVAAFGKGHERSMCFGEIEHPWSDQAALSTALLRRMQREESRTD